MSKSSPEETAKLKESMINALEINYGNIKNAAQTVGISPSTHFRWMKEDAQYEKQADVSKDVGYRNLKDSVIEMALEKAKKGDSAVLNTMLRILLKNLPDEMKILNRVNNVPITARIKYVDPPRGFNEYGDRITK